jgi:hypothetical protein
VFCVSYISQQAADLVSLFGFFVILLAPVTTVPLQFPPLRRPSFVLRGYYNLFWPQGHLVDGVNERYLVRGLNECFWFITLHWRSCDRKTERSRDRHEILPPFGYVSVLVAYNCRCKSRKMWLIIMGTNGMLLGLLSMWKASGFHICDQLQVTHMYEVFVVCSVPVAFVQSDFSDIVNEFWFQLNVK